MRKGKFQYGNDSGSNYSRIDPSSTNLQHLSKSLVSKQVHTSDRYFS